MPTATLPDIQTEADIVTLLQAFYAKVYPDQLLGPLFRADVELHWPQSLVTMGAFWKRVLLGSGGSDGWPLPQHMVLPPAGGYVQRWRELFLAVVEEQFTGPVAEMAKATVQQIAIRFAYPRAPRTLSSFFA